MFKTGQCNTEDCACAIAMKNNTLVNRESIAKPFEDEINISYTGVPLKSRDNKIIGALEIIVDNTEVKKVENKLLKQFDYQKEEVVKVIHNLEEISKGNFDINTLTSEFDSDTEIIGKNFAIRIWAFFLWAA